MILDQCKKVGVIFSKVFTAIDFPEISNCRRIKKNKVVIF